MISLFIRNTMSAIFLILLITIYGLAAGQLQPKKHDHNNEPAPGGNYGALINLMDLKPYSKHNYAITATYKTIDDNAKMVKLVPEIEMEIDTFKKLLQICDRGIWPWTSQNGGDIENLQEQIDKAKGKRNMHAWCCSTNPELDFSPISSLTGKIQTQTVGDGCTAFSKQMQANPYLKKYDSEITEMPWNEYVKYSGTGEDSKE